MFVTIAAIVILITFAIHFSVTKPYKFPPGPRWIPLLGCYMYFKKRHAQLGFVHKVLEELAGRYGNVVGLKLGRSLVVCASGYDAVNELINNDAFNGRPDGFFFQMRTFNQRLGLVFTDGPVWETHRKFSTQHLRTFGLGRKEMEAKIAEETMEFVQMLRNTKSQPIAVDNLFDIGVVNVLWAMIAGKRFAHDDARLTELLDAIHDCFNHSDPTGGTLNQVPALRHVAPGLSGYTRMIDNHKRLWKFFEDTIKEHRDTYCSSHCRDLVDAYLEKIDEGSDATFTDKQLLAVSMDFFMAGSETTNNTLAFIVWYLLKYPLVQEKLHNELDAIIGKNRCANLQDRSDLPYLNAFLMEVMRLGNVPPLSIPRRAMYETSLMGYRIPKGTTVLIHLHSVHLDPTCWPDAHEFKPERFLDAHGRITAQEKFFLPFGTGKRRCIGESLAKSNIYLFLTAMLHYFTVEVAPDAPIAQLEIQGGFTLSPKTFQAVFKPRLF